MFVFPIFTYMRDCSPLFTNWRWVFAILVNACTPHGVFVLFLRRDKLILKGLLHQSVGNRAPNRLLLLLMLIVDFSAKLTASIGSGWSIMLLPVWSTLDSYSSPLSWLFSPYIYRYSVGEILGLAHPTVDVPSSYERSCSSMYSHRSIRRWCILRIIPFLLCGITWIPSGGSVDQPW